ncbi:uncharacterized protein LOC106051332 [Biomphalaria glabrata]|uniref:Uncharacterized protein LOC106051332 n=1 Tax=Biomphalaria glabrata TaxID=6526 RepID=A0A9W2YX10_BIOGL|nr:uncharacterized protein LOC106051332 [Biomphalaria glabrata]XP_013061958.2 uncharacterized protein LOC106051332 [Biomphalaria glabrata]XP_055867268.1 uncharacterized protein LOC106051332 [Biomphalaria glabrata]XP_055867269.1 uncharacterized protein LOC106051332 [Biomphalaria glabrata]
MSENLVIKTINIILVVSMFLLHLMASFSGNWTVTTKGGVIYKSRGIYVDCTFNRCTYNSKTVSAWQDTARFLFYVMWTIILVTVIINGLSLWILAARLPRIFALLYFSAAVIGILITIIFPITVSPIGKDGLSETWFSSGFYIFVAGVFMNFTLSLQCYQLTPEYYPGA